MKKILNFLLFILFVFTLYSAPPHPVLLDDTEIIERYNSMFFKQKQQKNIIQKDFDTTKKQIKKIPHQTGNRKVLVLKVDFHNRIGSNVDVYDKYAGLKNSLKDYFYKSSYGKLNLDITIYPSNTTWYRAEKSYEYYGGSPNEVNVEELVREIVRKADNEINYNNYDTTGDGYVDHLLILHSGNDEAMTGNYDDIWSHQYDMRINTNDNVNIRSYAITAITSPRGVLYHEFGHELGMVDLYSISDGRTVIGKWCLMDYGLWLGSPSGSSPSNPNVWHKALVGWVNPTKIEHSEQNYSLSCISLSPEAVKIPINQADNPVTEYYLIENRQRNNYDDRILGTGLLIWHIDESIGSLFFNSVNSNHLNPRVKLITANNRTPRSTGGGLPSDTWENNFEGFGPYTIPAAKARNGELASNTIINNISPSSNNMYFNIFSSLNLLITNPPIVITNDSTYIINWNYTIDNNNISYFKITIIHNDEIYHINAGLNNNIAIPLSYGKNIVSVSAYDIEENKIITSNKIKLLRKELTHLKVTDLEYDHSPTKTIKSKTIEFTGTIGTTDKTNTLYVFNNETGDTETVGKFTTETDFSHSISFSSDGPKTVIFTATTERNVSLENMQKFNFNIDFTPPVLNVFRPINKMVVNSKEVYVSGKVDHLTMPDTVIIKVNNDTQYYVGFDSNDTFIFGCTVIISGNQKGDNINIIATDFVGNKTELSRTVIYKSDVIIIENTDPAPIVSIDSTTVISNIILGDVTAGTAPVTANIFMKGKYEVEFTLNVEFSFTDAPINLILKTAESPEIQSILPSTHDAVSQLGTTDTEYQAGLKTVRKFNWTKNGLSMNDQANFSKIEINFVLPIELRGKQIGVYRFDERIKKWLPEGKIISVNDNNNSITASLTRFSIYGLFPALSPPRDNLSNVMVYPNPFIPNDGISKTGKDVTGIGIPNISEKTGVHIDGLKSETNIKIYTILGQLVDEITTLSYPNDGLAIWNVRNKSGEQVASGVYLMVIKSPDGETKVKKLAIIR